MLTEVLTHYAEAEGRPLDLTRVPTYKWSPVRCPFHDDTQASASVHLELGGFKCHACEYQGDALKLIMMKEGLDYKGAREWAQEVLGQGVGPVRAPAKRKPPSRWRDQLFS